MRNNFRLQDYINNIKSLAKKYNLGAADAVDKFVVNLDTMHEHYMGSRVDNFNVIGQRWCALPYKEKLKQKKDTVVLVAKEIQTTQHRKE